MLIHCIPKFFEMDAGEAQLIDVSIPECDLVLTVGNEIVGRRPYANKCYLVACRKKGQKAINGIFVETDSFLSSYTVSTRWLVNEKVVTHTVHHWVLDSEFDAVSDDMTTWFAWGSPQWEDRWPAFYKGDPLSLQPVMKSIPDYNFGSLKMLDVKVMLEVSDNKGKVIQKSEDFRLPTIQRERLLNNNCSIHGRNPQLNDAFIARVKRAEA